MAILERNDKNSVAYILLNSPETLNSLSDEMLDALTNEFEKLDRSDSVSRSFCFSRISLTIFLISKNRVTYSV